MSSVRCNHLFIITTVCLKLVVIICLVYTTVCLKLDVIICLVYTTVCLKLDVIQSV